MAAKLTSIADGGFDGLLGGHGGELTVIDKIVDFSEHPSTTTDYRYIVALPAGTTFGTWFMNVLKADSVSGNTIDVGLYKAADDQVIDIDAFGNELAIGTTGIKAAGLPAGYATQMGVTEDAYIAITHGSGSASAADDAVVQFRFILYGPPKAPDPYS